MRLWTTNLHDLVFLMQTIKKLDTFKVLSQIIMITFMTLKTFKFMEGFSLGNAITIKKIY